MKNHAQETIFPISSRFLLEKLLCPTLSWQLTLNGKPDFFKIVALFTIFENHFFRNDGAIDPEFVHRHCPSTCPPINVIGLP